MKFQLLNVYFYNIIVSCHLFISKSDISVNFILCIDEYHFTECAVESKIIQGYRMRMQNNPLSWLDTFIEMFTKNSSCFLDISLNDAKKISKLFALTIKHYNFEHYMSLLSIHESNERFNAKIVEVIFLKPLI